MTCPYQIQNIGKCRIQNRSCNNYEKTCSIRQAQTTKNEAVKEIKALFDATQLASSDELTLSQNIALKTQNIDLQSELRAKNQEIQNIKNTIKLSLINFRRGLEGVDISTPSEQEIDYINWALSNLSNMIEEKSVQEP